MGLAEDLADVERATAKSSLELDLADIGHTLAEPIPDTNSYGLQAARANRATFVPQTSESERPSVEIPLGTLAREMGRSALDLFSPSGQQRMSNDSSGVSDAMLGIAVPFVGTKSPVAQAPRANQGVGPNVSIPFMDNQPLDQAMGKIGENVYKPIAEIVLGGGAGRAIAPVSKYVAPMVGTGLAGGAGQASRLSSDGEFTAKDAVASGVAGLTTAIPYGAGVKLGTMAGNAIGAGAAPWLARLGMVAGDTAVGTGAAYTQARADLWAQDIDPDSPQGKEAMKHALLLGGVTSLGSAALGSMSVRGAKRADTSSVNPENIPPVAPGEAASSASTSSDSVKGKKKSAAEAMGLSSSGDALPYEVTTKTVNPLPDSEKMAGSLNLNKLTPDANEREVLARVYKQNQDEVDFKRLAGRTHKEIMAEASKMDITPEQAASWKEGNTPSAVESVAYMGKVRSALSKYIEEPTVENIRNLKAYAQAKAAGSTATGQALNAHKLAAQIFENELPVKEKAVLKLAEMGGDKKYPHPKDYKPGDEAFAELAKIDPTDVKSINRFLIKEIRKTKGPFWWVHPNSYSNMLSAPSTSVVNLASNLANLMAVQPAAGLLRGQNPIHYYKGMAAGRAAAFERAAHALSEGNTISDYADLNPRTGMPGRTLNPQNLMPNINLSMDELTKGLAFSAEQTRMAMQKANKAVPKNLKGKARREAMKVETEKALLDSDVLEAAEELTKKVTLQREFHPEIEKLLSAMENGTIGWIPVRGFENIKPAKFIVPFTRIALNFMRSSAELSPLGIVRFAHKDRNTGDIASKLALGAGVMGYAFDKMANDELTGRIPDDDKDRAAFYAAKKKPFSVKINGVWVPYNYFGPAAGGFHSVAAYADAQRQTGKEGMPPTSMFELAMKIAQNFSGAMMSQSFVSGINGALDFATGDAPASKANSFATQMLTQHIPMSGAMRWMENTRDPYVRETDVTNQAPRPFEVAPGVGNKLLAGLPFLAENLQPKTDNLGRNVSRVPIRIPGTESMASAWEKISSNKPLGPVDIERGDPLIQELSKFDLLPGQMRDDMMDDGKKVRFTPEQQWMLAKNREKIVPTLNKIIASPDYIRGTDEEKKWMLKRELNRVLKKNDDRGKKNILDLMKSEN